MTTLRQSLTRLATPFGFALVVFANLTAQAEPNPATVSLHDKNPSANQVSAASKQYIPPTSASTRGSQGSGSRGCEGDSLPENLLTLLIPSKDYAGQTISGHPTFFWYLSQPVKVSLEFSLKESKPSGAAKQSGAIGEPLFLKKIDSPQAGINQLTLPKDRPELVEGKSYQWSVTLLCYPKRPSSWLFFSSWIERVPTTTTLTKQLAAVNSNRERASIYAKAGLWYDALTALITAYPKDSSVHGDFLSLLEQVGLTEVVKQERQKSLFKSDPD